MSEAKKKEKVKFTVDNGGDLSHLTPAERLGFQVARKYKESLK